MDCYVSSWWMSVVSEQEKGCFRATQERTEIWLIEVYEAFNHISRYIQLYESVGFLLKLFLGKSISSSSRALLLAVLCHIFIDNKQSPAGSYLYAPLRVLVKFWLSLRKRWCGYICKMEIDQIPTFNSNFPWKCFFEHLHPFRPNIWYFSKPVGCQKVWACQGWHLKSIW